MHALQPAPHFRGREAAVDTLLAWAEDPASPARVQAIVAAGGTGKTALVERVVQRLAQHERPPGAGSVLVWSFYERPDADAFLRECADLFLGEPGDAPSGGLLERLQRGLRDGRPHLVVLDGLERVQAEAGRGRARGQLEDHTIKLLLQAIAGGLGRTRALVTSRFPLVDLRNWLGRGAVETVLEDLPVAAARALLRGWGVTGDDVQLDAVAASVGRHALSLAVMGSYLQHLAGGRVEAAADFRLDSIAGDDPQAARLAHVLACYAERLPRDERELLARLSVFPRGITVAALATLVEAGGAAAGTLAAAGPALQPLLNTLERRGLVFGYADRHGTLHWTAHPFVRERFAGLLDCPAEQVFQAVAQRVGAGLRRRPASKPGEPALLDRYEQLIELTQRAGRSQEALDLYRFGIGGYANLGLVLGDFARGYRILSGVLDQPGAPDRPPSGVRARDATAALDDLACFARKLGRLDEAQQMYDVAARWLAEGAAPVTVSIVSQNAVGVLFARGQLPQALALTTAAEAAAFESGDVAERSSAMTKRAAVAHALGETAIAAQAFAEATRLAGVPRLYSGPGRDHARHLLDLGRFAACRTIVDAARTITEDQDWNDQRPWWRVLRARLALAEGADPRPFIAGIRDWTARTGDMEHSIDAQLLAARHALVQQDLDNALAEAEAGTLQARSCGFRLLLIELLVTLSRIRRAWPDAGRAAMAAQEALDLAAAADCRHAWGEADAAHALGEACEAQGHGEAARRAYAQALAIRERIGHPAAPATRAALDRLR